MAGVVITDPSTHLRCAERSAAQVSLRTGPAPPPLPPVLAAMVAVM